MCVLTLCDGLGFGKDFCENKNNIKFISIEKPATVFSSLSGFDPYNYCYTLFYWLSSIQVKRLDTFHNILYATIPYVM